MGRASGKHSKKLNINNVIPSRSKGTSEKEQVLSENSAKASEGEITFSENAEIISQKEELPVSRRRRASGKRRSDSVKGQNDSEKTQVKSSAIKGMTGLLTVTSGKHGGKHGGRHKIPSKSGDSLGKHDSRLVEGLPSSDVIQGNLAEIEEKSRIRDTVFRILFGLSTAAAVAIIVAIVFLPILKIYGTSMTPSLYQSDIVISLKGVDFKQGDVISFYYNNNILVKRVIATAGDWVDIDDDGNVSVNGKRLDEPYVDALAKGNCDIELPYQVPDGSIFVMGDHRATSKDSRSTDVGAVTKDKVVGKIVFRIWPLNKIGAVK